MSAWAVPTTGGFYKPLGIWFLGSLKYLAGEKKLGSLLKSISGRL